MVLVLGHLCPKNWDFAKKLPFERQSIAYLLKPSHVFEEGSEGGAGEEAEGECDCC